MGSLHSQESFLVLSLDAKPSVLRVHGQSLAVLPDAVFRMANTDPEGHGSRRDLIRWVQVTEEQAEKDRAQNRVPRAVGHKEAHKPRGASFVPAGLSTSSLLSGGAPDSEARGIG